MYKFFLIGDEGSLHCVRPAAFGKPGESALRDCEAHCWQSSRGAGEEQAALLIHGDEAKAWQRCMALSTVPINNKKISSPCLLGHRHNRASVRVHWGKEDTR